MNATRKRDASCECGRRVFARNMCRSHWQEWRDSIAEPCAVDGCSTPARAVGLCNLHWQRNNRYGSYENPERDVINGECAVDKCARTSQCRANGLSVCLLHYKRWKSKGEFGKAEPLAVYLKVKSACAVDGCETMQSGANPYCLKHATRMRRHGDPERVIPPEEKTILRGAQNPMWSGANATYAAVHQRLRRTRGLASEYKCDTCDSNAAQWSYDHSCTDERNSKEGPYSVNLERYRPRCVPCHKKFDLGVISGIHKKAT